MASVETLSFIDPQKILNTWTFDDPPIEEKIKFAKGVIKELANPHMDYPENVKQIAVAANHADDTFQRVTHVFDDLVTKYGQQLPELSGFNTQWKGYYKRWMDGLKLSQSVSSGYYIAKLETFEAFYLDKVQNIKTEDDKKDVIKELEFFRKQEFEEARDMSDVFKFLKLDIEGFAGTKDKVGSFEKWINEKKQYLKGEIETLSGVINDLKQQISWWDEEINRRTIATIACGASVDLIGLVVAGSLFADDIKKRHGLLGELEKTKTKLQGLTDPQHPLVNMQKDFNTFKPDFLLICEKLKYFAELFLRLQDEAQQYITHLKLEHPDEQSIELFKLEIQAAIAICTPLKKGLTLYSTTVKIPDHLPL